MCVSVCVHVRACSCVCVSLFACTSVSVCICACLSVCSEQGDGYEAPVQSAAAAAP